MAAGGTTRREIKIGRQLKHALDRHSKSTVLYLAATKPPII